MYKWDGRFLEHAQLIASWSKDESTQVGAIIVTDDRRVVSTGYNGLCRGVSDNADVYPERHKRPEKYFWYEHAERNCIYNAANLGVSTALCTMYSTLAPCSDCARAIIQCGIKRVVWMADKDEMRKARMATDHQRASIMMEEAGLTTLCLRKHPPR